MGKMLVLCGILLSLSACTTAQPVKFEDLSKRQQKIYLEEMNNALKETLEENDPSDTRVEVIPESEKINKRIADTLQYHFNRHSELVSAEVNDVDTDETVTAHQEIVIRVGERYTRNQIEEQKEALDAGTASSSDIDAIYKIQVKIEEAAQDLFNEQDLIKFVYSDINSEDIEIAVANKNGSILPLVK